MIPWGLSIFDDQTVVIVCYVNISLFCLIAHADNHPCVNFVQSDHVSVLNPFVPNAPFLYPLKTSENLTVCENECVLKNFSNFIGKHKCWVFF